MRSVRFVRRAFARKETARVLGQHDWTTTDRVLRALEHSGIAPVLIVANAPFLGRYTPDEAVCGPRDEGGLAAFERFLTARLRRPR